MPNWVANRITLEGKNVGQLLEDVKGLVNAFEVKVSEDKKVISFNTPWEHCYDAIEKIANKYPKLTITYEYADDQPGNSVGKYVFMFGRLMITVDMESYSKEAYEQYFELWGYDKGFLYSEEKGTYVYKG